MYLPKKGKAEENGAAAAPPAEDDANVDTTQQRELFIRGLGSETTTESFLTSFSAYGDIDEAIVFARDSGKCSGKALVTFRHIDDAIVALKETNKIVDGHKIVARLADPLGNSQSVDVTKMETDEPKAAGDDCCYFGKYEKLPPFYVKDGLSPETSYGEYMDAVYSGTYDSYMPEDILKRKQQQWERYSQQLEENDGFDLEDIPPDAEHDLMNHLFEDTAEDDYDVVFFKLLATKALEKYNNETRDDEVKYKKVVKLVHITGVSTYGYTYYITFKASKDEENEEPVDDNLLTTFQARVWHCEPDTEVELIRIKPSCSPS